MPNRGERTVGMKTTEGETAWMKFQVTDVNKALGAVKPLCAAGNKVVFDDEGSYILNKATGKITKMEEKRGVYVIRVWVPKGRGERELNEVDKGEPTAVAKGFQRLAKLM